jgi:hypothetical protein
VQMEQNVVLNSVLNYSPRGGLHSGAVGGLNAGDSGWTECSGQ